MRYLKSRRKCYRDNVSLTATLGITQKNKYNYMFLLIFFNDASAGTSALPPEKIIPIWFTAYLIRLQLTFQ
jgi:hypothetical protein